MSLSAHDVYIEEYQLLNLFYYIHELCCLESHAFHFVILMKCISNHKHLLLWGNIFGAADYRFIIYLPKMLFLCGSLLVPKYICL